MKIFDHIEPLPRSIAECPDCHREAGHDGAHALTSMSGLVLDTWPQCTHNPDDVCSGCGWW